MAAWTSYTLEDFLLFSPRVYWRMFELHNAAVWPLQPVSLLAGICIAASLLRSSFIARKVAYAALAVAWAWVGWSFLADRYAAINWAATYVAPVFGVQALLLLWVGMRRCRATGAMPLPVALGVGSFLACYGLILHPLLPLLADRPWRAAEIFGIAPDPTAIVTLGIVVAAVRGTALYILLAVPLAWCIASATTLYAMGAPEGWLPAVAAIAALAGAIWNAVSVTAAPVTVRARAGDEDGR